MDTNKVFVKMKPLFSQKNSIPVSKCYAKTPKTLQENRSNEKEVKDFKKAFHMLYQCLPKTCGKDVMAPRH